MLASIIGLALRVVAKLSPSAASYLAMLLFRTPRRFRTPQRELALLEGGKPFELRLSPTMTIKGWELGNGPAVILIHGWEGRGSQMATLARPIVEAGFRAITFDAPAHGASSGRRSSLPHFTWALRRVADWAGETHAVVGHSLGCAAAALAMKEGLDVKRAVFFAPPLRPADYTRQFGAILHLPDSLIDAMCMRIEERFLRKWDDYSLALIAPKMTTQLLIIHDRGDDDTPYEGGSTLATLWPGATLLPTDGLGHRRILRDPTTIAATSRFLKLGSGPHLPPGVDLVSDDLRSGADRAR
jgi:pimeloyl-ACP methyl ester carboxylesterase